MQHNSHMYQYTVSLQHRNLPFLSFLIFFILFFILSLNNFFSFFRDFRMIQSHNSKILIIYTTYMCVWLVTQSCLTLCDPMDYSLPGSSIHGILQARILEWVTISFSKESSQPRDWTYVFCVSWNGMQILYHRATWEALHHIYIHIYIYIYMSPDYYQVYYYVSSYWLHYF